MLKLFSKKPNEKQLNHERDIHEAGKKVGELVGYLKGWNEAMAFWNGAGDVLDEAEEIVKKMGF